MIETALEKRLILHLRIAYADSSYVAVVTTNRQHRDRVGVNLWA